MISDHFSGNRYDRVDVGAHICTILNPELISSPRSARGNNSLESAVTLTKLLRWEIQSLGTRIAKAASIEESARNADSKARTQATHEAELRFIIKDIKRLLLRIDDAVPLINLAITTSGATLSSTLPASVSTSRLLQGSAFLNEGDSRYAQEPNAQHRIGPVFTLSVYMLFSANLRETNDEDGTRDTTWKEVIHKARVRLLRVPLVDACQNLNDSRKHPITASVEKDHNQPHLLRGRGKANEYAYELEIIEDLDDDRVHSFEEGESEPGPYKDVQLAGIRETIPIHGVEKIFYADTGRILNINSDGEANNPILLLRRNLNATQPRRAMENNHRDYDWSEPVAEPQHHQSEVKIDEDDPQSFIDEQLRREATPAFDENTSERSTEEGMEWRFPANLDPEWLAFEVYQEAEEDSSEDEDPMSPLNDDSYSDSKPPTTPTDPNSLLSGLSNLKIDSPRPGSFSKSFSSVSRPAPINDAFGGIKTNLSLLEVLIRLTSLQQFQQASHLTIHDEILNFFLEESSSTGNAGSLERKRARNEAARKVGFDPYDESPVKKHGEEYQQKWRGQDDYTGDYDFRGQSEASHSRENTPLRERWDARSSVSRHGDANSPSRQSVPRDGSISRSTSPPVRRSDPWLRRDGGNASLIVQSSPFTPLPQLAKKASPLKEIQLARRPVLEVKRDSGLGTSPTHLHGDKEKASEDEAVTE